MPYRLDLTHPAPDALRAVLAEQLDDAVDALTERRAADPVKAVHEARKDLKKTRSALRLARVGLKDKHRRRLNRRVRAVAAQLSDTRDADVMVETIEALHARYTGQLPARQFTTVRTRFARAAAGGPAVSPGLLDELRALRAEVDELPLERLDEDALIEGAASAYARGREGFRAARRDPDTEVLHDWRKRVKDLWYHGRLLEEVWSPVMQAYSEEAHLLAEHLGDEHDLAVLQERLATEVWPGSVDVDTLQELAAKRRAELRTVAFALGGLLYSEKPKAYARRLASYR